MLSGSFKGESNEIDADNQQVLQTKVSEVVKKLHSDVKDGQLDNMMSDQHLELDTLVVEDVQPKFMCPQGSILSDKQCGRHMYNIS